MDELDEELERMEEHIQNTLHQIYTEIDNVGMPNMNDIKWEKFEVKIEFNGKKFTLGSSSDIYEGLGTLINFMNYGSYLGGHDE